MSSLSSSCLNTPVIDAGQRYLDVAFAPSGKSFRVLNATEGIMRACCAKVGTGFAGIALSPGNIVIMDNLSAHKAEGIREAIEATGATLRYLPPPAFAEAGYTRRTSIRSKTPSQNSRHCSVRGLREQSLPSGPQLETSSTSLRQTNVQITSQLAVMIQPEVDTL